MARSHFHPFPNSLALSGKEGSQELVQTSLRMVHKTWGTNPIHLSIITNHDFLRLCIIPTCSNENSRLKQYSCTHSFRAAGSSYDWHLLNSLNGTSPIRIMFTIDGVQFALKLTFENFWMLFLGPQPSTNRMWCLPQLLMLWFNRPPASMMLPSHWSQILWCFWHHLSLQIRSSHTNCDTL